MYMHVMYMIYVLGSVGLHRILKIAVTICRDCRVEGKRPAVIAMVKGQPEDSKNWDSSMEEEKERFIQAHEMKESQ